MKELRSAVKALLGAEWRAAYNDGWRFSRGKVGLLRLLLQIALAGLGMWRVLSRPPALPPGNVLLLGFVEGWFVALLMALWRGRERLFTGPLVSLVHLSPAPAQAVVLLHLARGLPGRAWFALLLGCALFPALDPWGTSAGGFALRAAGLLLAIWMGGVLGQLAGIGALLGMVRRWPSALVVLPAIAMLLLLGLIGFAFFLFTAGLWQMGATAEVETPPGSGALGTGEAVLAALLALMGLLALVAVLSPGGQRHRRGERHAYRESWLAVREALFRRSRSLRSRWPALVGGPSGAVQSLAWLNASRNWFSLFRLGFLAAGLAMPFLMPLNSARMDPARADAFYIGMGLAFTVFNYGEQAAALFSAEGERAVLPLLAGISPGHLLAGKWLAALPLLLAAPLTTFAWAAAGGRGVSEAAALAGFSGAIVLAAVTWLVGAAAFDAAPRTGGLFAPGETMAAAFEQVPTRLGGIVGLAGGALIAGAGTWLYLTDPRWIAALALPAGAAAVAGWRWVDRLWRRGAMG